MINKNFNFKKSLGQNFLNDDNIINKIVDYSDIDKDTLVIEVGPGSGVLTKKLAMVSGMVISYEIDKRLKPVLNKELSNFNNIKLIFNDFLKSDILSDINKYKYKKVYVVANLPYYITTPIINKLIEDNINPDKIVIMIQKEVADRITAKPGVKDYNSLTVYLNYHYSIKKLFDVSKNCFIPKPKVDSSVIQFQKKEEKYKVKNINVFYKLVRDSFAYKRKTLRNNLKEYDLIKIQKILNKYNLDLNVRAENISLEIFVDIANGICD